MHNLLSLEPVDYLVIGHVARDITPTGYRLGGTAAYSALTARALGLRVGVVTACGQTAPLAALDGIPVFVIPSEHTTNFENIYTPDGRIQYLRDWANPIRLSDIPEVWRQTPIIHLGPIAQEVPAQLDDRFSPALLGLTPQGWMRHWDESGRVHACDWENQEQALRSAGAVVLSVEDVAGDEATIEAMAGSCRLLVVTEGPAGARLYWNNDLRRFRAPVIREVDATGAGDIFAAAFFARLYATRDPWEAARFATRLASFSVTRSGLDGVPNLEEVQLSLVEVF